MADIIINLGMKQAHTQEFKVDSVTYLVFHEAVMVTSVCDLGPVQSKSGDQSVNTIDETPYQKRE